MIHLHLQPEIEAQLAAEAHARGLDLDCYVEKIVESRSPEQIHPQPTNHTIAGAIHRILDLRDGTKPGASSLPGASSIKDLINEGRRY